MSNFIVTGGLGGPLVITDGWGALAPVPTGASLIKFETGDLLINIEWEGDTPYLVFNDGINEIRQELPLTADEIAGDDWAIIKLVRDGDDLIIVCDKTTVATLSIVHRNYGGIVSIGEDSDANLFDIRIIPQIISKESSDYYIDDLSENGGDAMMPRR